MVIYTTGIGKMIRLMGLGNIHILMVPNMKVNGLMTSNMAKVRKNGQMAHNTKATTSLERKMVLESSSGPTDRLMKATS